MSQSAEEAQKKLKTTTLKLRQVEQTKLKDLQRALGEKEKIIIELQNRLKQYIETNSNDSRSPNKFGAGQRSNSKNKLIGNKKILEVQEDLESTNKFYKENDDRRDSLLPNIQQAKGSVKASIDRFSTKQSIQDSYDKHFETF